MKAKPVILMAIFLFFSIPSPGQNTPPSTAGFEPPSQQSIEKIFGDPDTRGLYFGERALQSIPFVFQRSLSE